MYLNWSLQRTFDISGSVLLGYPIVGSLIILVTFEHTA